MTASRPSAGSWGGWGGSKKRSAPQTLPPGATAALAAVVAVPFAGHLLFGANSSALALLLTALSAAVLCGLLLAAPGARQAVAAPSLRTPAALALILVLAVAAGLTLFAQALRPTAPPGPDLSAGLIELLKLAGAMCAFLAAFAAVRSDAAARRWFDLLTWGLAAFAAWSVLSFIADPKGIYGFKRVFNDVRLAGAFSSPNSAATVLGIGVLVGLGGLMRAAAQGAHAGTRALRLERLVLAGWPAILCLILCAGALLLTASRGGITATLTAGLVLMLWGPSRNSNARTRETGRSLRGLGVAVLAAVGLLAIRGGELVFERFGRTLDDVEARRAIFEAHWRAFTSSPLFGYGAGSFETVNNAAMTAGNYQHLWVVRSVHNVYLEQLAALGLLGFVPLAALVAWLLGRIVLRAADGARRGAVLLRVTACASLLVLLHGVTDYALQEPSIALFWSALLGAAFAVATRQKAPA